MTEALSEVPDTATGSSLGARVAQMADIIGDEHYPNGERAALRRWSPGQSIPLAFYRLWLRHLGDDLPPEFQTPAWMTIAWGLATLGKEGHGPRRSLGQALAESQFSERRLEQLLSAPEDVRPDLFMSAVRFLAAKGERFDWRDGAAFLLTQDNEQRQRLNHRIAAAFYRHQTQN
jgi:CRISPR system Cascade subunit CasB